MQSQSSPGHTCLTLSESCNCPVLANTYLQKDPHGQTGTDVTQAHCVRPHMYMCMCMYMYMLYMSHLSQVEYMYMVLELHASPTLLYFEGPYVLRTSTRQRERTGAHEL
jgi:hypothetical protein